MEQRVRRGLLIRGVRQGAMDMVMSGERGNQAEAMGARKEEGREKRRRGEEEFSRVSCARSASWE